MTRKCRGLANPVGLVVTVEGDEEAPGRGVGAGVADAEEQPEHGAESQDLNIMMIMINDIVMKPMMVTCAVRFRGSLGSDETGVDLVWMAVI